MLLILSLLLDLFLGNVIRHMQFFNGLLDEGSVSRRGFQVQCLVEVQQRIVEKIEALEDLAHLEPHACLLGRNVLQCTATITPITLRTYR